MTLADLDRRILWVRAGGRCTLCKKYLLEGDLTTVEVPLGEGAHVVGAVDSENSPRGKNPLPVSDRDTVDNVMLACSSCLTEIDKLTVAQLLDVRFLLERKREHEADIKLHTGLLRDRRTAVLRMAGNIRGAVVELPRHAAADAVIRGSQRFPFFLQSYDRQGIEIDLQQLPGEHPLEADYYRLAVATIDTVIDNHVTPGVRNGDITHISVFTIARLPLLIYLGAKLDDGSPADVYQRHRATDSWTWPDIDDPATDFDIVATAARDAAAGVLVTNLSGTAMPAELPDDLHGLPTWTITPSAGAAEDVFAHPAVLDRFEAVIRSFFTTLESTHKALSVLHVIGPLPLSGAVMLGRALKSDPVSRLTTALALAEWITAHTNGIEVGPGEYALPPAWTQTEIGGRTFRHPQCLREHFPAGTVLTDTGCVIAIDEFPGRRQRDRRERLVDLDDIKVVEADALLGDGLIEGVGGLGSAASNRVRQRRQPPRSRPTSCARVLPPWPCSSRPPHTPPPEICDADPAVMVPSLRDAGLSPASDSAVVLVRMASSAVHSIGSPLRSGIVTDTTSSVQTPSLHAAAARCASDFRRDLLNCGDPAAHQPWFKPRPRSCSATSDMSGRNVGLVDGSAIAA